MMNNKKPTWKIGLALLAVLAVGGFVLGGCDSDTTAPQDEIPPLSKDSAGMQAALTATALASLAPEIVRFDGLSKELYSYVFTGTEGVTGTVNLEYFSGGSDGDPATFDMGDYAHLWTPMTPGLVMEAGSGGSVSLDFDIEATVVQVTDTATIMVGSGGTFTSGDYVATFNILDLVVTESSDYPSSGSMTFSTEGFSMEVTYDGTNVATIAIAGEGTWTVNLDTAELTEIT